MLLRSSSTPVIGSLLASISAESPNNHFEPKIHHTPTKFSFHQPGPLNISRHSSSISSIDSDRLSATGFLRRAQSDGNLEALVSYCDRSDDDQFFCDLHLPNKSNLRSRGTTLQTIPSFSYYSSGDFGEEDGDPENEEEFEKNESVIALEGDNFGLDDKVKNMSLSEDMRTMQKMWGEGFEDQKEPVSQEMHLAKGLGIGDGDGGSRGGGGSRGDASWEGYGGDGGDNNDGVEEHYQKMVEANPGNPLFLGNYAKFLYQTKRDLPLAEVYYSRSILADPNDGEILAQYANLVWELHNDEDRASSYYERAMQAAPQDSHVHAAYASFLWETEDDESEADVQQGLGAMPSYIHGGIMTSASA